MAMFVLTDATGIGTNDLDPDQAAVDLAIIANDTGIGVDDPVGGRQLVTYNRTQGGAPQLRLDALVNTAFSPDYGSGPQNVDTIIIAGLSGFTLDDGTSFANNGTALPPAGSGLAGSSLNTTANCLVIYDTQQTICVARDGTDGDLDLPISNPVVLFHEFSHAFRILNNTLLALTGTCDPASPEENAAIVDENTLRTDIANRLGETPELRDPNIHCGTVDEDCSSCCIIATLVSKSFTSYQVQFLRSVRDHFVRKTEVGHAFFEQFFRDYYSFSPQVCTIMARNPSIPELLLEGYINPLLDFWKIMIERSRCENMSEAKLGASFVSLHLDPTQARSRRDALNRTISYWLYQDSNDFEVPAELLTLLKERAWSSDYIQWALVAPIRIYYGLLTLYLDGADEDAIGREFNHALESWAPEMPISRIWASLTVDQVVKELEFCENVLLQTAESKKRFHERLKNQFYDITSIGVVLNDLSGTLGGIR